MCTPLILACRHPSSTYDTPAITCHVIIARATFGERHQGDPVYIRCARCGLISDRPYRISSSTTYRPGRPPEHAVMPPEWNCPSCGRAGPLEVGEQLPNDTLTRCRRTFLCRYTWKVPRDLATVTCPRCETRQPAAHVSD